MATTIPGATLRIEREDVSLDQLVFEYAWTVLGDLKRAGRLKGFVEATLAANPGLASRGPILPLGLVVTIPEFIVEDRRRVVRLWD
ncbi:MAG TPA: tail protein X [Hyphomicrobiales bacterium]|nr:tail protein X [Kaistiaceae bacterium]HQF30682.1 tail protein X [Hyphomicrobiales bacterium]